MMTPPPAGVSSSLRPVRLHQRSCAALHSVDPSRQRLATASSLLPQSDPVEHRPSSTSPPLSRSNPRAHLPPCVQEPIVLS